ncbi:MAG: hypothetical protein IJU50_04925 [Lachnospiraceae bacterium]|nr:hypothetical protein [Lachnospiraceae bacterium]
MEENYFRLARAQEKMKRHGAALLLYISSFCEGANLSGGDRFPQAGVVAKIRQMQLAIGLSDSALCSLPRSYGHLTDEECQRLLFYSLCGNAEGIRSVFGKTAYEQVP